MSDISEPSRERAIDVLPEGEPMDDVAELEIQLYRNGSLQAAVHEAESSIARMARNWGFFAVLGLMVGLSAGLFLFAPMALYFSYALFGMIMLVSVLGLLAFVAGMLTYVRLRMVLARTRVASAGNCHAMESSRAHLAALGLR